MYVNVLILVNVIVFILSRLAIPFDWFRLFMKSNPEIQSGEYYRLITAGFLHADITHIFLNMYSLANIGPSVYRAFPGLSFTIIYFGSLLGGSLASYLYNTNPSVGASGAIFGLIGSLLAYAINEGNWGLINNILLIVFINAAYGLLNSRIDNWGHAGGFIAGFAIAWVYLNFANLKAIG